MRQPDLRRNQNLPLFQRRIPQHGAAKNQHQNRASLQKPVKLGSEELFKFPFVIMTGEDDFNLTAKERINLKKYLENGGFMLASPGCSNKAWSTAFLREIKRIFGKDALKDIPMDHAIFKTITTVKKLPLSKGGNGKLQGIAHNGKLVVAFASDGLNDTSNTEGCCC